LYPLIKIQNLSRACEFTAGDLYSIKEGVHGWKTGFNTLDDMLDGIEKPSKGGGKAYGFAGAPQHAKLLSFDTPILTTKGWKNHGDLREGDYVFGRYGSPVRVLGRNPDHIADRVVTFSDGERIECNAQHEWIVQDTSAATKEHTGEKTIETQYLESIALRKGPKGRGGRYRFQVDAPVLINMKEQELALHPYILGLWLGDGRSTASDIAHDTEDKEHIEKAKKLYNKKFPYPLFAIPKMENE